MIKTLRYKVKFASTGRSLEETIVFQKGFGTITGANEAGKSAVVEYLRWMLFGSAALRGTLQEYAGLEGELTFSLRDKNYRVVRTKVNATLYNGSADPIAVGTGPVNNKLLEIIGFGLPVFDVACVANQGDIERLGSMPAPERKRLIDTVLGLGVIDDMARWAGNEARETKRGYQEAERFLTKPDAPKKPKNYQLPADLQKKVTAKEQAHTRILQLSMKVVDYPQPTDLTEDELEQVVVEDQQVRLLTNQLARLPGSANALSEAELTTLERAWADYDQWLSTPKVEKPTVSKAELQRQNDLIVAYERWQQKQMLSTRLEKLEREMLECPSCQHRWSADPDDLDYYREELNGFKDVAPPAEAATMPQTTIRVMLSAWEDWDKAGDQSQDIVPRPSVSRAEIREHYKSLGVADERVKLEAELAGRQPLTEDPNALLIKLREFNESERVSQEILQLKDKAEGLADLRALLSECQIYDRLQKEYETNMVKYISKKQEIDDLKEECAQLGNLQKGLLALRAKVKQFFVPSLNKVASHFLQQMTGGQRQIIKVDEEFNIEVDGQGLHTLSGSGKAVANLALRLGLGQVLTNNLFSLFIGDEIDASMDQNRSDNTSRVLHSLKSKISQILLVTHKYPAADYYIHVGDTDAGYGSRLEGRT